MSIEDLQNADQHMSYVEGLLQQAVDSISTAIAYAVQDGGSAGAGIHQGLTDVEQSLHQLQNSHATIRGELQAALAAQQQHADESESSEASSTDDDNPYN